MNRVLARSLAVLLTAAVLVGCSGSGDNKADPDPDPSTSGSTSQSPTESPTEEPYLPVPEGVELTDQGSKLSVGDRAVVAYEPRKDVVGVLDIKVTRLEKTTIEKSFVGWQLDDATKKSTPYFVHVVVKNAGDTNLGKLLPEVRRVPLYIVDGTDTLIESSSFASKFKPCLSSPLPEKFRNGDKTKICLVYLAPDHGKLTAVSFRPTEEFNPIVWTGDVQKLGADKPGKGKNKND